MLSGNILLTPWNYAALDQAGQTPAVVSGGSWLSAMPASSVQTRYLADNARSADTQLSSTILRFVLSKPRLVQFFCLNGHNFSSYAKWRVTGWADTGFTTPYPGADSGWIDAYPGYIPWQQLAPEYPNWLSGKPDLSTLDRMSRSSFLWFPSPKFVQAIQFEINDQLNPAGFVDVGTAFISPVIQTAVNFLYGSTIGWSTETKAAFAKGGTRYYDFSYPGRVAGIQFKYLNEADSFALLELDRRMGIDRDMFVCLFPDDLGNRQYYSFQCTLNDLSRVTWESFNSRAKTSELRESI